jgi:hypothetical protein
MLKMRLLRGFFNRAGLKRFIRESRTIGLPATAATAPLRALFHTQDFTDGGLRRISVAGLTTGST